MKSILVDAFVIPPQSGSALPGITDGGLVQEKQWNLALKGVFIFGIAHFVVIRSPHGCESQRGCYIFSGQTFCVVAVSSDSVKIVLARSPRLGGRYIAFRSCTASFRQFMCLAYTMEALLEC